MPGILSSDNSNTVAVAMSGGVDSSVAAALALRQGYRVIGVTLNMDENASAGAEAAAVAAQLGIAHYCVDCREKFLQKVIIPAAEEYCRARTPNPCCVCNRELKFAELIAFADEIGASRVWSGHYAAIDEYDRLRRGADRRKDQSYFLYRLTSEQLKRIAFPLGSTGKAQVRELAAGFNLVCAEKPDSQDTCFAVPGENCGDTLCRRAGMHPGSGRFIYRGRAVGRHDGIHRYTIGQRQGLNVALGVPAYISSIDPVSCDIVLVTDQDELKSRAFILRDLSWQTLPAGGMELSIQVRYRSPAVPCRIEMQYDKNICRVEVDSELRAVTPGQAGVLYAGDLVLGGGVIDGVEPCF